ncbi:MAG TPA: hypothetical protein DDY14_15175 [Chromatiaceae bacterium]|jgi:hypothetical protein|nr:MAG: hypothetical protein N838_31285 [Thiohalocapsa sp. PB-PSB1]QQO52010.1 MAG: hypothetical protein N838_00110 [Thiohalocapsa sp. PB-PSB1]HBG96625.1 hypothetical protein [Chromatiaceae bacterium]HCS88962.1 hypothetical protein [Chromatiaceae bacterium]
MNVHPEYIVDENSNKKSVVIPFSEWKEIVEEIEELEDIRAYDRAKQEVADELVPFDEAVKEIRARKLE